MHLERETGREGCAVEPQSTVDSDLSDRFTTIQRITKCVSSSKPRCAPTARLSSAQGQVGSEGHSWI
ncbi:jg19880 [Pararge aegeria aegeria]|uniref:Jg19880 protein n=1 Tax=Pararge aegeria aegeria TaxID=348720 RepID=A0A8S4R0I9_9NEOP|nr:jg19880 [Pararge aegeria aegeria]